MVEYSDAVLVIWPNLHDAVVCELGFWCVPHFFVRAQGKSTHFLTSEAQWLASGSCESGHHDNKWVSVAIAPSESSQVKVECLGGIGTKAQTWLDTANHYRSACQQV